MKINILLDKLMSKEELIIKINPENNKLAQNIKDHLNNGRKLTVINAKNDSRHQVDINSVLVFQSEGHMCSVKMKTGELYLINKRLKELEKINENHLSKINNQTIINLDEIEKFSSASNSRLEVSLSDHSSYLVSRNYVKSIKERLSW
ncbi:LytTR family DNA-binding domain-containing protein [Metaclostridioides mangenotii]|uniref:LytTR family DNA-binding domain-containing protein n=1 Tax=Metaclostridioides mangenotii TaxID=1540 RepID=UPI000464FD47|nr:LytTR family DNA-binding domain-containing protein [Clostridioides mangenotii]